YRVSNTSGTQPARLLHSNYLPLAMSVVPDTDLLFNNPARNANRLDGSADGEYYSTARAVPRASAGGRVAETWVGNFFPDMRAWDQLVPFYGRAAGGTTVFVEFPRSPMTAHMSVFAPHSHMK